MIKQEVGVEDKLCQFIKDYCDGQCSQELLLFLGRHRQARFSYLAILHALGARRLDIDRALQHLMNKGLVKMSIADNGLPLYSLTRDESLFGLVSGLAALDWWQWQIIREQTSR